MLPMPAKYRELLDCAKTLNLEDEADEEDMVITGYASLIAPEPLLSDSNYLVEATANTLFKLTPEQVSAVQSV